MGFTVRSSIPLNYLRQGIGQQGIAVYDVQDSHDELALLQEWPSSRGELSIRLLDAGDGLVVENDLMGRFRIEEDRSRILVPPATGVPAALREAFLWSTPFAVAAADAQHVFVHAAAVAVGDRAVLLVGNTRAGKTTLSAAFHAAGHRLLSDDGARCHARSKTVWPGPALLRMRADMAERMDRTGLELIHQTLDKTHFAILEGRRGDGRPVPIEAIVFLNWGSHRTESLSVEAAIARLWRLSFHLPYAEAARESFEALGEIATAVPSFDLFRPRGGEAMSLVIERLVDACLP